MIIDTNILIDYQNGVPSAIKFIQDNNNLSISIITALEMITGFNKKQELFAFKKLLSELKISIIHFQQEISELAYILFVQYRFRNHIDLADVIIAATASYHKQSLATLNIKHFRDIAEIDLIKPY